MKQHVRTTTSLTISEETNRGLDILRDHLNSPKAWIIARLVDEELKKEGINAAPHVTRTDASLFDALKYADVTRGYSWDRSDYDYVLKKYREIVQLDQRKDYAQKRKRIATFENRLNRFMNDQSSYDDECNKLVEPLDITQKIDRITNSGRTRAAELIAGEAANRFDYAAVGTSQFPVSDSDAALGNEKSRINLRLSGYASASGAVIKHSALWTPGLPSDTFWEFAPVDVPIYTVLQMIWARVVFPQNKGLLHVANADFFTITHSTYTQSLV